MTSSRRRHALTWIVGCAAIIFVVTFFVMPQSAEAAVGPGGSSSGGGGACPRPPRGGIATCPYTTNGQGWYEIPVNAAEAPRTNGYWDGARSQCSAEGANSVMAYVVLTGRQTLGSGWIYRFQWGWERGGPYTGNVSVAEAQARFYQLRPEDRAGYTFGDNLGWFCYNYVQPWDIQGESYVKNTGSNRGNPGNHTFQKYTTALPGDRLNWYHDARNIGPRDMNRDVNFQVNKSGFSNGWNGTIDPTGNARGGVGQLFIREYASESRPYTLYDVTQNDVGNRLCQQISWDPASWNTGGRRYAQPACVDVPYRYSLVPSISNLNNNDPVESQQGPIEVRGNVSNDGPTKSRPNLNWQLTQIKYRPSPSDPPQSGGGIGGNPCQFFTGEVTCTSIASGTDGQGVGYPGNKTYIGNGDISDEPVGTKICFAMSVQPYTQDQSNWRHSQLYCRIVTKKPKVQVLGGDVIVGKGATSNIATSIVRKNVTGQTRTYGSWGEYAVTASGRIYGMASGAGYSSGNTDEQFCAASYLTITNAGSNQCSATTSKGVYAFGASLPPIGARFSGAASRGNNPTINVADTASRGIVTGTGTIRVTASGDIAPGQWVVINAPEANVVIAQNIRYTGAQLTAISQIPQIVIIANNISIEGGVGQVDAWLIANGQSGRIVTCSDVATATALNAATCGQALTVNGPVAARQLMLYRTAGSGTGEASGDPAETFNLRPDAYLWATNFTASSNRLQTATTRELPPRF